MWNGKRIVCKYEKECGRDDRAQDEWGPRVFRDQTFYMRIRVDHSLMDNSFNGLKETRLIIASLRRRIITPFLNGPRKTIR